jgi:hypothetical protein
LPTANRDQDLRKDERVYLERFFQETKAVLFQMQHAKTMMGKDWNLNEDMKRLRDVLLPHVYKKLEGEVLDGGDTLKGRLEVKFCKQTEVVVKLWERVKANVDNGPIREDIKKTLMDELLPRVGGDLVEEFYLDNED